MKKKKHAKFSASSAHRWLNCPGSIRLSEKAPPQAESEYAREGTLAHECLEYLIESRESPKTAERLARLKYPAEMVDYGLDALKFLQSLQGSSSEFMCEQKVSLEHIHPEMFGTLDAALVDLFGHLHVFDYKYGAGIAVNVVDNPQLAFYALALAHRYDYNFEGVSCVVIQPRAHQDGGPIRFWKTDVATLQAYGEMFKRAAELAESKNPPLCAGDWCRFCPAKIMCPEISTKALAVAKIEFDDLPSTPVEIKAGLTPAELATALTQFDRLDIWMSAVRKHAFDFMRSGGKIPGFKLVEKRGRREWVNAAKTQAEALKRFGPACLDSELKSPAQLEKLVGKKWVNPRVATVSSGLTLAGESDPRPETTPAELDFQ